MSKALLRDLIDLEGCSVERGTKLYEYLYSLKSNTVEYKGKYYLVNLTYFQDEPAFELIDINMENILQLERD